MVIMGAGGRDFHDFNVLYRDDPDVEVVAFTATQIPGIDDRRYPAALAGPRYPHGIPIRPEAELRDIIEREAVDEVAFCYSDVAHVDVMHLASRVLATGAGFRLHGPRRTMLQARVPVVAVCAVRTGSGKSPVSRRVAHLLEAAGLRTVLVRHPMPYGALEQMAVQRFATLADIDAADPTIEEREEYEAPVREGLVMWAGVDYEAILRGAEEEADVIVWDGGNNDLPFVRPDLLVTVVDPLRAGDELAFHPGEANLVMADVVVVNKIDVATPDDVTTVLAHVEAVNPAATVIRAGSPVTLGEGPELAGRRVLVVEDGPTITHGGMPSGAGLVAARAAGATDVVEPRPFAVGSLVDTYARFPHIGPVLPAMGYDVAQRTDLEATIAAARCDVVVSGTPIDLTRVVRVDAPVRRASYELREVGSPELAEVLVPLVARARAVG
nr:GTP-binding protein [Rhabdothermincola salaria]